MVLIDIGLFFLFDVELNILLQNMKYAIRVASRTLPLNAWGRISSKAWLFYLTENFAELLGVLVGRGA